jgi:hypothetical protein
MRLYIDGGKIPVTKCKRPSFKNVRGRTWDKANITIDGKNVEAYLDTTWGHYIYLLHDNQWYKFKLWSNPLLPIEQQYNINNDGDKLSTMP